MNLEYSWEDIRYKYPCPDNIFSVTSNFNWSEGNVEISEAVDHTDEFTHTFVQR